MKEGGELGGNKLCSHGREECEEISGLLDFVEVEEERYLHHLYGVWMMGKGCCGASSLLADCCLSLPSPQAASSL